MGFLLELPVILCWGWFLPKAACQCLVTFASLVLGRGAGCSQVIWGLCGFSPAFNQQFPPLSLDLLCLVLYSFSGDLLGGDYDRPAAVQRTVEETSGNECFTSSSTARRGFGATQWCPLQCLLSEWPVAFGGQDRWISVQITCKHKALQLPEDRVGESASARSGVVPLLPGPHGPPGAEMFLLSPRVEPEEPGRLPRHLSFGAGCQGCPGARAN